MSNISPQTLKHNNKFLKHLQNKLFEIIFDMFSSTILLLTYLAYIKEDYRCLNSVLLSANNKLVFIYDNVDLFFDIFEQTDLKMSDEVIELNIINYETLEEILKLESNYIYVIIVTNIVHFEDIILKLHSSPAYNTTSITVVFYKFTTSTSDKNTTTQRIFQKLWQLNILNVLVIDASLTNNVYTYKPITHDRNNKPTILYLGECASLLIDLASFQEKSKKHFDNCSIKISANPVPFYVDKTDKLYNNNGYEIIILKMVLDMLHLNGEFLQFGNDEIGSEEYINNKYSYKGMMKQIFEKQSELLVGYIRVIDGKHLRSLYPAIQVQLSFVVPKAKPIAMWKNTLLIFQENTWILFLVTVSASAITRYFMLKCSNYDKNESLTKSALYIIQNCINSVDKKPNSNQLPTMIFFVFFSFGSLLIVTYYQSQLSSFLSKPIYKKQITNMHELAGSDVPFGGYKMFRKMFVDVPPVYNKWFDCGFPVDCINYFKPRGITEYAIYDDVRRAPMLFPTLIPLEYDRSTLQIAPIVTKGCWFEESYKAAVMRVNEAGFTFLHEKRKIQELCHNKFHAQDTSFQRLTFENLQVSFLILVSGLLFATTVFTFETILMFPSCKHLLFYIILHK